MAAEPVPITRPTATPLEAVRAVLAAYRRLFERSPAWRELLILAAQSSHETGKWRSMPCYNVAGIKASVFGHAPFFEAMTTEHLNGRDVRLTQRFRAYHDLADGVFDWLSLLHRGYPQALEGAALGDVLEFVEGLWQGWGRGAKYFTAPFQTYSAAVRAHLAWLDSLGLELDVGLDAPTFGEGLVGRLDGADDDTFTPDGDDE